MAECDATACTDVTGFGLIGHCAEMAEGAGVTLRLKLDAVPVMPGVVDFVYEGLVPAGTYRNRDYYAPRVKAAVSDPDELLPLFDPQTSGGLLVSLAPADAECFLASAAQRGCYAVEVGEVIAATGYSVEIA